MVWYSYGNTLNAIALLVSSLSYNRDTFADSTAMQQNQTYQEKNYHINWIASVREEMRDFLTIFVGRLQNSGVLNTLLFALSTGFLCEGRLDSNAPQPLVLAYYSSLMVSMLYFACSILFSFVGAACAYDEGTKFMMKFVPDVPDLYNFDFVSQLLEWEGKGEALRVPFVMDPRRLAEKKERQRAKAEPEGHSERLEKMRKSFKEPTTVDYLRKGTAQWKSSPERDLEMDGAERSFYEIINQYTLLWEPCCLASDDAMALGVFALLQSFAYYFYGLDMTWPPKARMAMFVTMTLAAFSLAQGLTRFLTLKSQPVLQCRDGNEGTYKLKHWLLKLLMLLGPAMVVSSVVYQDDAMLITGYVSHGAHHAFLACLLVQSLLVPKESSSVPAHPEEQHSVLGSTSTAQVKSDPWLEARESPELMLRQLWINGETAAKQTSMFMSRLLLKSHVLAFLPWAWLALVSSQALASRHAGVVAEFSELRVSWSSSSSFFQARAMTCSSGRVWLASENGVFEVVGGIEGGFVKAVGCAELPLDDGVQDIAAQCSESGCWPLVLGKSGRLYNCGLMKDEATVPLTELQGVSGIAFADQELYVRKLETILHLPSRQAAARPLPGLMGFDILPSQPGNDVFLFSADKAATVQIQRAAGELQKWASPPELPLLRAACAIDSFRVLAAVQDPGAEYHPRLVIFQLR